MKCLLMALLLGCLATTPFTADSQTRTHWIDVEAKYMGGVNAYGSSLNGTDYLERASFSLTQVGAHFAFSNNISIGYTYSRSFSVETEWESNEAITETKLSIQALVVTYRTGSAANRWRFAVKVTGGIWFLEQTAILNPDASYHSPNFNLQDYFISSTVNMMSIECGISYRLYHGLILYPLEIAIFNLRSDVPLYEFGPPAFRFGLGYQFRLKKK